MNAGTKRIVIGIIIIILIFAAFFYALNRVSSLEFSDPQKEQFCTYFNMSIFSCVTFWEGVTTYNGSCPTCTNTTIVENNTIFLEKNCSQQFEFLQEHNRHAEELARIQHGEPTPSNCLTRESCDLEISQALVQNQPKEEKESDNTNSNTLVFVVIAIIVGGGLFYYFKRKKPTVQEDYQSPIYRNIPPVATDDAMIKEHLEKEQQKNDKQPDF